MWRGSVEVEGRMVAVLPHGGTSELLSVSIAEAPGALQGRFRGAVAVVAERSSGLLSE